MPKKTKKDPESRRAEKKKEAAPLKEEKPSKTRLSAAFAEDRILLDGSDESRELYNQSRYGSILESGKIQLSLVEGLYLLEKGKIDVKKGRSRLTPDSYLKIALEKDPNFYTRYYVFKDIRNRGYIIKTALKFGADFRVYDRGIKPGEDHAKWIVYPVHESSSLTWYEFAAKNRVAHSTKKRLLIGIVDDEGDCTYYEIRWMRP